MSDLAIRCDGLSKQYRIGQRERYRTLRDTLTEVMNTPFRTLIRGLRLRTDDGRRAAAASFSDGGLPSAVGGRDDLIWALKDVSFEITQGEVVGVIGRNGAGKSTLLKILSRITEPTEGHAEIHGRIGSLLEVGTGFHPELTGRENIYLNGAILGMKKTEIERKFDEIVAFAEVEKFVDTPVKHYSSGMHVRLAFAVAAHLEPEILLVDEVLAVGDAAFQKKCLGKMGDVAKEGHTVLLVSHNMGAVEALCGRAYLLDRGYVAVSGKSDEVIEAYLSSLQLSSAQPLSQRSDRQGSGRLKFTDIAFRSHRGVPTDVVQCGRDLEILVGYRSDESSLQNVVQSIGIFTLNGQCMLILNNQMVGADFDSVPSVGKFSCMVKRFPLTPGEYYVNLYCEVNGITSDWVQQAAFLTVEAGDFFGTGRLPPRSHGGLLVAQRWRITDAEEAASSQGRML